jgi:hypothetical protein
VSAISVFAVVIVRSMRQAWDSLRWSIWESISKWLAAVIVIVYSDPCQASRCDRLIIRERCAAELLEFCLMQRLDRVWADSLVLYHGGLQQHVW